jgi:hypothetical protein
LCTTLGKGALSWLSVGYGVASWNHSFCQSLRCSGVALCLWLGDNGVALSMVKQAQHSNTGDLDAQSIDVLIDDLI